MMIIIKKNLVFLTIIFCFIQNSETFKLNKIQIPINENVTLYWNSLLTNKNNTFGTTRITTIPNEVTRTLNKENQEKLTINNMLKQDKFYVELNNEHNNVVTDQLEKSNDSNNSVQFFTKTTNILLIITSIVLILIVFLCACFDPPMRSNHVIVESCSTYTPPPAVVYNTGYSTYVNPSPAIIYNDYHSYSTPAIVYGSSYACHTPTVVYNDYYSCNTPTIVHNDYYTCNENNTEIADNSYNTEEACYD